MSANASEALASLQIGDSLLYCAGYPNYSKSNYTRDGLTYGLLAQDREALEAQIAHSAVHQGRKKDSFTGEEPGKIHHELPGVRLNGLETTYNACDTTASFLRAIAWLASNGKPEVLHQYAPNIEAALGYIESHIGPDHLFREDPRLSGTDGRKFALKVTYWKDSVLNGENEEPRYPIVYTLAHFQNAGSLRAIGTVMNRPELLQRAEDMEQAGISRLWKMGHFVTAIDADQVEIDPPNSDSLHALLHIEPGSLPKDAAHAVEDYMIDLETDAGYRTGLPLNGTADKYHTGYVWPHEQAELHAAANKHHLERAKIVSRRVLGYLNGGFPELIDAERLFATGNKRQLWVIGAAAYLASPDRYLEAA